MKSLELNWIRKKVDKSIPMPEVVFYPLENASGRYHSPQPGYEIFDLDGKPHPMVFGAIVVDPESEMTHATIAHEWRHHWQHYHGVEFEISPTSLFSKFDFDTALLKYFTESKTEMDALRFEYKFAGIYPEWEKTLYDILKDLMVHPIITYGNTILNRQKIHARSSTSRHSHTTHKKTRRV